MKNLMELLPAEKWLELNAKLQQKKNALRQELADMGVLKREGVNTFDNYKYYSEAQYKKLFERLLAKHRLEITPNEVTYDIYEGSQKQPNGRVVKVEYTLTDIDTGFFEVSSVSGEGMDKGDKAGYKAYTGSIKYYLANTFMVATGDDPEKESPEGAPKKPSDRDISALLAYCTDEQVQKLLDAKGVEKVEDLPADYVRKAVTKAKTANTKAKKKEGTQFDELNRQEETF